MFFELDITIPLARGRTLNLKGTRIWKLTSYEKLPRMCLRCGRISHYNNNGVYDHAIEMETEGQFGVWKRAKTQQQVTRNGGFTGSSPDTSDSSKTNVKKSFMTCVSSSKPPFDTQQNEVQPSTN